MIKVSDLKAKFDNEFYRENANYTKMIKTVYFYRQNPMIDIQEQRDAKWYQKSPHYRPTGKPEYLVTVSYYDDPNKPMTRREDFTFSTLKAVTALINSYGDMK